MTVNLAEQALKLIGHSYYTTRMKKVENHG